MRYPDQPGTIPTVRQRAMIAVMIVAALMDLLDLTIVNVALPTVSRQLGARPEQLTWIVAGYMLAFGATLIFWGRVGDLAGRRRLFLTSVAAFGLASLAAGLAPNAAWLVAARLLQGAAAGAMVPQVLATFRASLDQGARLGAFAAYGATAGLAAALGVILGGLLTQYSVFGLGWRAVFLINVPIALGVIVFGWNTVPESRPGGTGRLDLGGALLLTASLALTVSALVEGRPHGWPVWIFLLLALGMVGLGLLIGLEHRRAARGEAVLLQTQRFRVPAFSAGLLLQALFSAALQGFSVTFVLWLQLGHGYTPLQTGLTLIAFTVGSFFTAPVAGRLAARQGYRVLLTGAALLAVGSLVIGLPAFGNAPSPTLLPILGGYVIAGAGLSLLVIPLVNVVLAAVPGEYAGGAAGLFSTAQQIGGALGVALLTNVFFGHPQQADHLNAALAATVPLAAALFAGAGLLCFLLPGRAVSDTEATLAN